MALSRKQKERIKANQVRRDLRLVQSQAMRGLPLHVRMNAIWPTLGRYGRLNIERSLHSFGARISAAIKTMLSAFREWLGHRSKIPLGTSSPMDMLHFLEAQRHRKLGDVTDTSRYVQIYQLPASLKPNLKLN